MVAEPRLGVGAVLPVLSPTNRGRLSAVPSLGAGLATQLVAGGAARDEMFWNSFPSVARHPVMTSSERYCLGSAIGMAEKPDLDPAGMIEVGP